jgi:hypothetical protein
MSAPPSEDHLIAMATAAASALVGDQLNWADVPEGAKSIFRRVASAVIATDRPGDLEAQAHT